MENNKQLNQIIYLKIKIKQQLWNDTTKLFCRNLKLSNIFHLLSNALNFLNYHDLNVNFEFSPVCPKKHNANLKEKNKEIIVCKGAAMVSSI